jgi:hypothetical protein
MARYTFHPTDPTATVSVYTGSNGAGHHSVAGLTNAAGNVVLSLPVGVDYIGWASTATGGETLYPTAVDRSNPYGY